MDLKTEDLGSLNRLKEYVSERLSPSTVIIDGKGEVVIRTGLTVDMNGELYPLAWDSEDDEESDGQAPSQVLVCHTGTDTWFSLTDTSYIISADVAHKEDVDGLMLGGYLAETAKAHGYEVTPELAQKIYELVEEYYGDR